eukprot:TRINITY_DN3428_c0_g1_i1.p1 TRINITY_DN3428_c0_g1~~TRINITY_DN3428_c0_g1_i1.p1  ORF type:complete len:302 (+),score=32.74 TRINITY_DN3428_c0_g1_i1:66-908(+)
MEPFISRDNKWVFWNSRNVGNNVSLNYGSFVSSTYVIYINEIQGQANGPVPHLDAVPAMDSKYNLYWVSTRDYPQNAQNLQTGVFDPQTQSVPVASHVEGDFYIKSSNCCWIVMDQEINIDGSLLFYVNAYFPYPPGAIPSFSNISLAIKNADGTWSQHPRAVEILASVNSVVSPTMLRYGPSSLGTDALEFYFTVRVNETVTSALFVAKRNSIDDVFGEPERIAMPYDYTYIEPEAPTLSVDGSLMMFSRLDCQGKYGCINVNIYSMYRNLSTSTQKWT